MGTIATSRLLAAIDVGVEAFALCEIAGDACLVTPPIGAVEVHYVVAGTLHYSVPGTAPIALSEGSVVVTPTGMPQRLSATPVPRREVAADAACGAGPDGMVLFDAAGARAGDLRVLCGKVRTNGAGSYGLLDGLATPIAAELADVPFVRGAFETMLAETSGSSPGARVIVSALMKACLAMLLRRHLAIAATEPGLLVRPGLARAVAQVMADPAAPHSVASLASEAGMSRSAFAKAFGSALGVSPMAFVSRTRMVQARNLLTGSGLPVAVVAARVGMASRSHFSRLFRSSYGCDPSAYRRRAQAPKDRLAD